MIRLEADDSTRRFSLPAALELEFHLKTRGMLVALVALLGLYVWLVWGDWQSFVASEWLRLGIAFLIFLAPGWMLQHLLWRGADVSFSQRLAIGFGAAVGMGTVLGLVGTALSAALPFVMAVWCVILIASTLIWASLHGWQWQYRRQLRLDPASILMGGTVFLACLLAVRLTMRVILEADDLTYNAYLVRWLEGTQWDWNEIFWGTEQFAASRFWLAYWTLDEALLARWSGIAGIELTRAYLPPFLALVALLATYALARGLEFSRAWSSFALTLQLTAMLLLTGADQPGLVFLNRQVEDKAVAAFVLTPVFVLAVTAFLKQQTVGRIVLTGLVGSALVLTHPTIMAITAAGVAVYVTLYSFANRKWRAAVVLGVLLVVMLLAPLGIRFFDSAYADKLPFDANSLQRQEQVRRLYILSDWFFMINPNIVWGLPFLWTMVAGIVGVFQLKNNFAAQWVVAATLVLLSAIIPLTAPLWGITVSAIHLWRIVWIIPFGIAAAYLSVAAVQRITGQRMQMPDTPRLQIGVSAAALVCLLGALFWVLNFNHADAVLALQDHAREQIKYENLRALKPDVDKFLTEPAVVVGGNKWLNERLPGLSANVRVAAFRSALNMWLLGNLEWTDAESRFRALRRLFKGAATPQESLEYLEKYNVRFIVAKAHTPWVDAVVADYPSRFRTIETRGELNLYRVLP